MDYEKKYKEALERAKKLTSDMTTLQKIREFIFPELRESEDERIRKELVNFILYKAGHLLDEDTEHRYITYLEKQKESTWTDEDESFVKHILPRILNPDKWTMDQVEGDRERLKEFIDRQKCKWLERQKEQKPAEWGAERQKKQDEKEQADLFTIVALDAAQRAKEQLMKEAVEGEIVDSGFDDGTAILKAIVPDRRYDSGDKVKLIIIKDDGKSD